MSNDQYPPTPPQQPQVYPQQPQAYPQQPNAQPAWGMPQAPEQPMPWGAQQPPAGPGGFVAPPNQYPQAPAGQYGQVPQPNPFGQQPPAGPYGQQPPAGPYGQPPAGPYGAPGFGGPLPEATPLVPVSKGRSKVLSRMVPVVVGLGLVAGGGIYGVSALTGGAQGGADSATAAVESMFTAFENEDVLGVIDSLTPAERDVMVQPMQDIAVEMQRLGIASDSMDLAKIEGVDFEIQGLELKAKPLSEDVVAVYITGGTLTSSADPALLPVGDELARIVEDLGGDPIDEIEAPEPETEDLGGDVPIVAIKRNGRWGVSLGYTIAENARLDAGESLPDFGADEVVPVGGDTPEAAIEGMMGAVDDGDLAGALGYVDPEEMAALYDYAPLFLDDAQEGADAVGDAMKLTSLDLVATGSGDRRQVIIQGFSADVDADGETGSITWDGECAVIETDVESIDTCDLADDASGAAAFGFDQLSSDVAFSVHKVDGRWYVSPTRTVLDQLVSGLRKVDDDTLQQLSELFLGMGGAVDDAFETCVVDEQTGECGDGF